jgi:hypothetical protein
LNPGPTMAMVNGVVGGIAQVISVPFVSIPFTLLYYDGRIRKEGFDLEMMARNLGAPGRPATPAAGRAPARGPVAPEPRMGQAPPASAAPPAAGLEETLLVPPTHPAPPAAPRGPVGPFKVCPKCGAQVSLVRPACPNCGTAVPFRPAG